jgi:hypothetical protein
MAYIHLNNKTAVFLLEQENTWIYSQKPANEPYSEPA